LKKKIKTYIDQETKTALLSFKEKYINETGNKNDVIPYRECINRFVRHYGIIKEKEKSFRKGGRFSKILKELFVYTTIKKGTHYYIEKIKWIQEKNKNNDNKEKNDDIKKEDKKNDNDHANIVKNREIKSLSFEEFIESIVP